MEGRYGGVDLEWWRDQATHSLLIVSRESLARFTQGIAVTPETGVDIRPRLS